MNISFHRYLSPQAIHPTTTILYPITKVVKIGIVIALCLMLVACGTADDRADQTQLTLATQQIAQDYALSGDLANAQAGLAALDVANPNQWLLYVAETTAKDGAAAPELVNALIKLTDASGLRSPVLARYSDEHGLTTLANPSSQQAAVVNVAVVNVASIQPQPQAGASANLAQSTSADSVPVGAAAAPPAEPAILEPTATVAATAVPIQPAQVSATTLVNLRAGPGTVYDLAGSMQANESAQILAKNEDATWWKVQLTGGLQGWVFAELVQTSGSLDPIAAAADIPPTPTSAPIAVAQATQAPTQPAQTEQTQPVATPAPQQNSGAPYFRMTHRRMWAKAENGDCRGQHLLRITVVDTNGARLNGVTLKGIYTGALYRTGDQGKGDGIIEFDLYGGGEGFTVVSDVNGAEASSDRAEGFTTQSRDIDKPTLIQGGYCSDDATCQTFYDSWGCNGHHSWEATFQRNY